MRKRDCSLNRAAALRLDASNSRAVRKQLFWSMRNGSKKSRAIRAFAQADEREQAATQKKQAGRQASLSSLCCSDPFRAHAAPYPIFLTRTINPATAGATITPHPPPCSHKYAHASARARAHSPPTHLCKHLTQTHLKLLPHIPPHTPSHSRQRTHPPLHAPIFTRQPRKPKKVAPIPTI